MVGRDTINRRLEVTRWAVLQRWEVKSWSDRRMEESGQGLKDEKRMKDGSGRALWQSGKWMTLRSSMTEQKVRQKRLVNCPVSEKEEVEGNDYELQNTL